MGFGIYTLTCKDKETLDKIINWKLKGEEKYKNSAFKTLEWRYDFYKVDTLTYLMIMNNNSWLSFPRFFLFCLKYWWFLRIRKSITLKLTTTKELFNYCEEELCRKKEY